LLLIPNSLPIIFLAPIGLSVVLRSGVSVFTASLSVISSAALRGTTAHPRPNGVQPGGPGARPQFFICFFGHLKEQLLTRIHSLLFAAWAFSKFC
jgi:hypothetical protein